MPIAIHSISKILVLPIVIIATIILYISSYVDNGYSILIFIPAVLLVILYVLQAPLDHWWKEKYPIPFDPNLREWLNTYFIYYTQLSSEEKEKYEYRLGLYLEGRLFQSVGSEVKNVPADIQCMVAAHSVLISFYNQDYLIGDFDRIYLYKHPFPTPKMHTLHSVEVDTEDGVIILSLEQSVNALLHRTMYYNVVFHAFIEAWFFVNNITIEIIEDWDLVQRISGFDKGNIEAQIGDVNVQFNTVLFTLFFTHRESMNNHNPEIAEKLNDIWKR